MGTVFANGARFPPLRFPRHLLLGPCCRSAQARSIVIDINTSEVWSDADEGNAVQLPFPVDYGAGPQSSVTVHLPTSFSTIIDGLNFAVVGLTFTNSPADNLFATVDGGAFGVDVPGLRLSNETETSRPTDPVDDASIFDFGNVVQASMPPPPFGASAGCDVVGISMSCYGPMEDSAVFHFIDLSSIGKPGDFELVLACSDLCGNIGFNLAGLSFSADDFDPTQAPTELVSYSLGQQNEAFHQGTWDFVFRSPTGVPEPDSWVTMLLGFGLLGIAFRRGKFRARHMGLNDPRSGFPWHDASRRAQVATPN